VKLLFCSTFDYWYFLFDESLLLFNLCMYASFECQVEIEAVASACKFCLITVSCLMSFLTRVLLLSSLTLLLFHSPRFVCYTARECIDVRVNVLLQNSATQQPGRKLKQVAGAHHGEGDYIEILLLLS
jgi:hypothetical protein